MYIIYRMDLQCCPGGNLNIKGSKPTGGFLPGGFPRGQHWRSINYIVWFSFSTIVHFGIESGEKTMTFTFYYISTVFSIILCCLAPKSVPLTEIVFLYYFVAILSEKYFPVIYLFLPLNSFHLLWGFPKQ